MRQVVLDTETTGLEISKGHRVIEIGCVEMVNRRRTNRTYHQFIQPDREIDEGAQEVHGITSERLASEPRFQDIADTFLEFVSGAELIIHNAAFDVGFLNNELVLTGHESVKIDACCQIIDTLPMAREIHPGQRNNLDALCKRYQVDNSGRDFHGALLDAQLLADVYLAMTGGQGALSLDANAEKKSRGGEPERAVNRAGIDLVVLRANKQEIQDHERQLDLIDDASPDGAVWRRAGD
jgi:DNA polymerase-3 subunit epsilon